jgi:PIN domain nuclease of toxin-antitoxin system
VTVLDASAVLALVHDEPGADLVATHVTGGTLGTANLAEVMGNSLTPTSTLPAFVNYSRRPGW